MITIALFIFSKVVVIERGISRNDLHHLYYGLSIAQSMELDGGGSAALALKADGFTVRGDARPDSSCNEAGLWCSLITQPDGKHRPVPSWIESGY